MKNLKMVNEQLNTRLSAVKKLIFSTVFFALFSMTVNAQNGSSFGVKGGLNYNSNGDYFESIGANAKHPDRNIGYHLGFFGKIGDKVYFRPELFYTSTKSDYDGNDFKMKKFDAPMLVGFRVLGPLNVFGGPAFQYILDTDFNDINIKDVKNDFTVGLNFGIGIDLGKLGLDLRYERGFNENEATFINTDLGVNPSRLDTRPDQLILSLSVSL